jgi:hypothetical protein
MLAPQGYDLKASERIGHLDAVNYHIFPIVSTQGLEGGGLRHLTCGIKVVQHLPHHFTKLLSYTINEALANTLYSPQ